MIHPPLRAFCVAAALAAAFTAAVVPAQVVSYHGVSSATHQSQFTTLSGQGYRLISLAVGGGLSAPTYTAVWENVGGPAWLASHDMTLSLYTSRRATWISQGYRAKLISAAGSGTDTVYAAVFVNDGATVVDNHAYTASGFDAACQSAQGSGLIPVSVDIRGTTATPLYCAVFEPNARATAWGHNIDASHTEWTETYNAHTPAGARLGCVGMSDAQEYLSVWYDDRIGSTAVRSNYTSAGFGTQVTTLQNANYDLLCVAAGGSGSSLRIAGGFATRRTPYNRVLSATGQVRSAFAAIEAYMASKMQSENARAGSIAIAKDGRLVFARAYTYAEPGYPITQPTSLFRVASLAKVPTAMAIHELDERNLLAMTTRPQVLLNIPYASGDSRFTNITVQHCLEYRSGMPRNYSAYDIAAAFYSPSPAILPANRWHGALWLGEQALEFTPGTLADYANTGHFLLGQVAEDVANVPLQTFLQNEIYAPLGITRARIAGSLTSQLFAGETLSHLRTLTLSSSELHSDRRRLASQYANDLTFKDASGGTSFSSVDFVRLLAGVLDLGNDGIVMSPATVATMRQRHSYTPGTEGPGDVCPLSMSWSSRPNGVFAYKKGGTLDSASAEAIYRTDGITIAAFFNQGSAHADDGLLNQYVEAITAWPTDDLFPSYGLPSFPRTPALASVSPGTLSNVGNTPFVLTGERLDSTTSVAFTGTPILSQSPTTWQNGYFRIVSPTQLEVFPPQGLAPGLQLLVASNGNGSSNSMFVGLATNAGFTLGAPPQVNANQGFLVLCSRGAMSAGTLAVFGISTSSLPSVTPGVVTLGIGNQWTDLIVSPVVGFDATTRTASFPIPPLPFPVAWFQAAALDGNAANPFPLPVTNVRSVVRL